MVANGVKLDTLKECLEFLQWLHSDKNMQYRVTRRLKKLLEKKYAKVNEQQIDTALSTFLTIVSKFYTKLCQKAGHGKNMPDKARDAFYALLQCIPKFLSVMYYLRYNVDSNFAGVGGGRWAKQQVGMVAMYARLGSQMVERMKSTASDIEKYLIEKEFSKYSVIPGGFDPSDLKQIGDRDSYSEGSIMLHDLINICDKKDGQLFRDVFVTSVLSKNSGVDVSNIANALRMVEDFCGIFENVEKDDFTSHVQSRGQCINWQTLKDHCIKLKESLGKMFKQGVFSFTGYGRTYGFLDKKNIAKKMANWFRANLDEVRMNLARITSFDSKQYNLKTRKKKLPQYYAGLGAHLAKYLFPYGFTFEGRSFKTGTTPYEDLKKHWDAVIGDLKKDDGGLATLKKILDGNQCANGQKKKEPKPQSKPKPGSELKHEDEPEPGPELEPEDEDDLADDDEVDSDEELMKELSDEEDSVAQKTDVTKTEAVKPVVTKADKSPDQGKKVEGAQNQGKKGEGAQNQGKKVEGDSPTALQQDAHTQSPGAPDPSSGQEPGGQGSASDAVQQSSQEVQTGAGNSAPSRPQQSVTSSGGAEGSDGSVEKGKTPNPSQQCQSSNGYREIELWQGSGKYCIRDADYKEQEKRHKKWDEDFEQAQRDVEERKRQVEERLKKNIEAAKLRMEVEERIKEGERQLQRRTMLPGIDVVYRPREFSENLEMAYNAAAQNHLDRFVSPMPFEITKPTNRIAVIDDDHGTGEADVNGSVLDSASGIQLEEFEGTPVQHLDEQSKQQQDDYSAVDITGSPGVEGYEMPDPFFDSKRQTEIDKELGTSQKNMDSELRYQYYKGLGEAQTKWKQSLFDTEQAEKEERKKQMDARLRNIIERVQERNERKNKAAQNLDKKLERTTEDIWETQLQQNLDYIEENVKDADAKKRLQQKRLRQQKQLEQQNVSHDSPTSTVSALPSQPGSPAPAPSSQNTGGRDGYRRIPFVPREEDLMQRGDDVIYPNVYSDPVDPFAKYGYGLGEMYTSFDGQPVVDKRHEKEDKLLREKNKNDAKRNWVESHQRLYAQTHANSGFSGTPTGDSKGLAEAKPFHDNASVGIPMGMVLKPKKPAIAFPPLPQKKFGPGTPAVPQGIDLTKNKRPTKLPSVITPNDTTYVTGEIDIIPIQHSTDISGAPIKDVTNKIPMAKVQDTLDYKLLLPDQPTGYPITNSNQDTPVQQPPPKFKPSDVRGSVTSGFISDVESWRKKEVMYNNIKRDLEAHKKALANDQERRIKEAQRYGEGFKNMVHMHDDDRNQHLLDDVQESTETLKIPSPRKLQDIVYPNEKPYVAPPVIEALPHGLQSTEVTGDASKTFIDVRDSESLPEVGLSVDILKHPPFQPLNDYDYGPSYRLPPAIGGDKEGANTFDSPRLASERGIPLFANPYVCQTPWSVTSSAPDTAPVTPSLPPATDHLPPPKTVREMLYWFVGLNTQGYIGLISEHFKSILMRYNTDAFDVTGDPTELDASMVTAKLTEACLYAASVIYRIRHHDNHTAYKDLKFESVYSQLHYSPDPAALVCQLRDYVYACCHQLAFLQAQCNRAKSHGGWQDCKYGSDITASNSPLQAFLTDGWESTFKTHPFDPCNLCHKSRVRMGFRIEDLPVISQLGSVISTILTPSCGGEDPLLTLASYLNCLTRRTPRTTGELVSYFHNFGNLVYNALSQLPPISPSLILRLPTH